MLEINRNLILNFIRNLKQQWYISLQDHQHYTEEETPVDQTLFEFVVSSSFLS